MWHNFPYTNFHELNLDWILNHIKDFGETVEKLKDEIDDAIKYMKDNIVATTQNIINQYIESGELYIGITYDAETEALNITLSEEVQNG